MNRLGVTHECERQTNGRTDRLCHCKCRASLHCAAYKTSCYWCTCKSC